MRIPLRLLAIVMSLAVPLVATAGHGQGRAVGDFLERVDAYVSLHRRLERSLPPLTVTRDPSQIAAASDALADAIVAARPGAKQGDIFTPEASVVFRARILETLGGAEMQHYLEELYEGEDFERLHAAVHGRDIQGLVPAGVPVALLWALPELPDEVEYRVIGRDLALWDHHASMVVDFIPRAFPELSLALKEAP